MSRTHRGRSILATVLVAVGLVWLGQGSGLLTGQSFMIGDVRWAVAGVVAVAIGIAMLMVTRRRP
jgi:hypothetical protein